jgi:ribonuclease HIII
VSAIAMMIFSNQQIEEKLQVAIAKVVARDSFLLEHEAHERSVAHKLGKYLQQEFGDNQL